MNDNLKTLVNRIHPLVCCIPILLLLWILFFWRLLSPIAEDQASFKQGDFSGQFVAFGAYQYERMSHGEIPLWNPYNNGGLPFIADTQAAVFYPLRLVTIALATQFGGWSYHVLELEAIFHVLLYSLLMFAFLYRLTNNYWGALIGSIIAAYGGFISGYPPLQLALLEASIWLPLALLGLLEATRGKKLAWRWLLLAGFGLGVSWLAGHPQTSWFSSYFLVTWLGFRSYQQKYGWRVFVSGTILMGIITFGVTAITLLPGAEYLLLTSRSGLGFDAKGNGFPFQDIAQFIFPGTVSLFSPLYVGIPALILVFIAIRNRWQDSRFWVFAAFFGLILSFGANTALFHALYNPLPGLRFFRGQERAAFIVANSLAILAAMGMSCLSTWSTENNKKYIQQFIFGLLALIGGLASFIFVGWLGFPEQLGWIISISFFSTLIIAIAVGLFLWQLYHPNRNALMLIVLLIGFELFSVNMDAPSNYDSIPANEQLNVNPFLQNLIDNAPDDIYRVDGFRGLQANYGSFYSIMDIRGISPLFLESPWNIIYHDYANNPRAWEIFAVRYIFSERDAFGSIETQVIGESPDKDGHIFLHEIINPRPFAHLVYRIDIIGSDAHAVELLNDPNYEPRENIILQQEPNLALPDSIAGQGTAMITEFRAESFTVEVSTSENAILSLAQVDYPGWKATRDSEAIPILRAYGALAAVEVPAGEHIIRFVYDPMSYRIGVVLSLLTWGTLIMLSIIGLIQSIRHRVSEER
jgi:uncharacterized membrane protein YfhO